MEADDVFVFRFPFSRIVDTQTRRHPEKLACFLAYAIEASRPLRHAKQTRQSAKCNDLDHTGSLVERTATDIRKPRSSTQHRQPLTVHEFIVEIAKVVRSAGRAMIALDDRVKADRPDHQTPVCRQQAAKFLQQMRQVRPGNVFQKTRRQDLLIIPPESGSRREMLRVSPAALGASPDAR